MGGPGSGRYWRMDAKGSVDDFRRLDIRRLQQEKLLIPGNHFAWAWYRGEENTGSIMIRVNEDHLVLGYSHRCPGEDWQSVKYPVCLSWSDCHLGGRRPWFLCPAKGCSRRVAILYGTDYFVCRHCSDLAYPSQREEGFDRLARRANKVRTKLGWKLGILNNPDRRKPNGMHWKTFHRLTAQHDVFVKKSLTGMAVELGWLRKPLQEWK
ncbi:MAG: hypothetical protein EP323_00220 [Gammaproteobacteria bacterium]|nr:MAG: hypothetical protein EP323_00220 [Gammaproteobacteria bacterium]